MANPFEDLGSARTRTRSGSSVGSSACRSRSGSTETAPSSAVLNPADPESLYELLDEIASGAFGTVYKANHIETKEIVALKICGLEDSQSTLEELLVEVEILQKCSHPNIVKVYGAHHRGTELFIGMELCAGGAITDIFKFEQVGLEEPVIAHLLKGTLQGLAYLHSIPIVHRDIKGENVLLTADGIVKLVDFGVSKDISGERFAQTFIGTPYFMAPEVISCKVMAGTYTAKADIWATGIMAIELAETQPPLYDLPPMRALLQIPRRDPPKLTAPEKWSAEFSDFISKCLQKDPNQRPTCEELLQHSFLNKACPVEEILQLIKRKEELEKEEFEDDDGEEVVFDESLPGSKIDEDDLIWFKKATMVGGGGADDDLELLDEDDINSWLQQPGTIRGSKKKTVHQPATPTPAPAPVSPRASAPAADADAPDAPAKGLLPVSTPTLSPIDQKAPTSTAPKSPAPLSADESDPVSPRLSPASTPTQSLSLSEIPPLSLSDLAPASSSPRSSATTGITSDSKAPQVSSTKGAFGASFSLSSKSIPTAGTTSTTTPPVGTTSMGLGTTSINATVARRRMKRQGSRIQLQEKQKVQDHKRFLALAKALSKLSEQHKAQLQKLVRTQQKDLQDFIASQSSTREAPARRGTVVMNEDRLIEKEAEQLAKQHIMNKRQAQARQGTERSALKSKHATMVQSARAAAKGDDAKLREAHALQLKLTIEEHVLLMRHFVEAGELDLEQMEQQHIQQLNHQLRLQKTPLDQVMARCNVAQEKVKQKYLKMIGHLEKLSQLEREQQLDMQKAEQGELNRQAIMEYKKWQKDRLPEHKKTKDEIKLQKVSREQKNKLLLDLENRIKAEAETFKAEWEKKKAEDVEMLTEIQQFQQEALKDGQQRRLEELQQNQEVELRHAMRPKVLVQVEHCKARLELLALQKEQHKKALLLNQDGQRELLHTHYVDELAIHESHLRELASQPGTPRQASVKETLKTEYEKRLAGINTTAAMELEAAAQPSSMYLELQEELKKLEEELEASKPHTVEGVVSIPAHLVAPPPSSGSSISAAAPAAPAATPATPPPPPPAPHSGPPLLGSIPIPAAPQAPPVRSRLNPLNPLASVVLKKKPEPSPKDREAAQSAMLQGIKNFDKGKGLKSSVTKDSTKSSFALQGLFTSIQGFSKGRLKNTSTNDRSAPAIR